MKRFLSVLLAAIATACISVSSAAAAYGAAGFLQLDSRGLPRGLKTIVTVAGTGGRKTIVFPRAKTLQLAPGRYSIAVKPVVAKESTRGVQKGATAYPEKKKLVATVAAGRTVKLTVVYRAVLNPSVRPLPSRLLKIVGDSSDPTGVLLPLRRKAPRPGTIYTAAPSSRLPRGLISKVTRVKKVGSGLLVLLEAVPATEAVPSLEFNGALDLRPSAEAADRSASASASACSPPKLNKFKAHMDSFELRQASLSAFPPQMRLTVGIRTTESLGLGAAAIGVNCDWTLAELGPFQGAIPVGPIVIPVFATVPVKVGAHINGKLDLGTINIASTAVASAAAGVSENRASLSLQGTNVWTSGIFALAGSARLYASVGVQAGIGVAKGANVHLDLGFGPEFEWSSGHACGVYANLGSLSAGVSVLGRSLDTPRFTPLRPRLWSGCTASGGDSDGGSGGAPGEPGGGGGGTPVPPVEIPEEPVEIPEEGEAARALQGVRATTTVDGTTCALLAAQVDCWGWGGEGDLGNAGQWPTFAESYLPVEIPNLVEPTAIAESYSSYCATLSDGRAMCWGINNEGQEGNGIVDGPFGCRAGFGCSLPMEVLGLQNVTEFTGGGADGRCALVQNGHVFCWGRGDVGELGNGEVGSEPECNGGSCSPTPVEVQGIGNALEIAGSLDGHYCAILSTGEVKCWGNNSDGQLGVNPSTGPEECAEGAAQCSSVPIVVPGVANAVEVRVGRGVSCALLADGNVKCWGQSVLLNGAYSATPVEIEGVQEAVHFAKVSPEVGEFLCVVRSSGGLSCWGDNREGDLGNGQWSAGPNPSNVSGLASVTEVALPAEGELACARLTSGEVDCWGDNYHGELGNGTGGKVGEEGLRFSAVPVKVLGIDDAVSISVGGGPHRAWACAILADETEKCWGENLYGQLGNGRGGYKNYPPAEDETLVVESSNRPVFVRRPE